MRKIILIHICLNFFFLTICIGQGIVEIPRAEYDAMRDRIQALASDSTNKTSELKRVGELNLSLKKDSVAMENLIKDLDDCEEKVKKLKSELKIATEESKQLSKAKRNLVKELEKLKSYETKNLNLIEENRKVTRLSKVGLDSLRLLKKNLEELISKDVESAKTLVSQSKKIKTYEEENVNLKKNLKSANESNTKNEEKVQLLNGKVKKLEARILLYQGILKERVEAIVSSIKGILSGVNLNPRNPRFSSIANDIESLGVLPDSWKETKQLKFYEKKLDVFKGECFHIENAKKALSETYNPQNIKLQKNELSQLNNSSPNIRTEKQRLESLLSNYCDQYAIIWERLNTIDIYGSKSKKESKIKEALAMAIDYPFLQRKIQEKERNLSTPGNPLKDIKCSN